MNLSKETEQGGNTTESFYQGLYEKHSINAELFQSSYKYYIGRPEIMKDISSKVTLGLKALEDDVVNSKAQQRSEELNIQSE